MGKITIDDIIDVDLFDSQYQKIKDKLSNLDKSFDDVAKKHNIDKDQLINIIFDVKELFEFKK